MADQPIDDNRIVRAMYKHGCDVLDGFLRTLVRPTISLCLTLISLIRITVGVALLESITLMIMSGWFKTVIAKFHINAPVPRLAKF